MVSEQPSNGDKKNGYVSWKIFCWTIGIILVIFGMAFTSIASLTDKVDKYSSDLTEIKVQLSGIQVDLNWIKINLK